MTAELKGYNEKRVDGGKGKIQVCKCETRPWKVAVMWKAARKSDAALFHLGQLVHIRHLVLVSQCQQKSNQTLNQEGKGSVRLHTWSKREHVLIRGESWIKEILLDEHEIKQISWWKKRGSSFPALKCALNFNGQTLLDLFNKWWAFDLSA